MGEFAHGQQADRAAPFWDGFYAEAGDGVDDDGGKCGGVEWILEPEAVLPGIVDALEAQGLRPKKVLEIGCGESALAERLHRFFGDSTQFVAVDISEVALDRARRRAADHGVDASIRYLCADVTDMSELLDDGAVDLVVDKGMSDTLQFRARTAESRSLLIKLFAEVFRVLAPCGCYIVATPKARIRYLRTVGWSNIERKVLLADERPLLVRGQPGVPIYLHICCKSLVSAGRAVQNQPPPCNLLTVTAEDRCSGCGLAQTQSRYKNKQSWARHQTWCVGA